MGCHDDAGAFPYYYLFLSVSFLVGSPSNHLTKQQFNMAENPIVAVCRYPYGALVVLTYRLY